FSLYLAHSLNLPLFPYPTLFRSIEHPLLSSIMRSNRLQIRKAYDLIANRGKRKIALLGLSFKANTDDLRESPLVELADLQAVARSEEHTSELQSREKIVCRLLLE